MPHPGKQLWPQFGNGVFWRRASLQVTSKQPTKQPQTTGLDMQDEGHPPKESFVLSIRMMPHWAARAALEKSTAQQGMGTGQKPARGCHTPPLKTHRSFTSSLTPELSFLAWLIISCWETQEEGLDTVLL